MDRSNQMRFLGEQVLLWMRLYNEVRPANTFGVIVPSLDELLSEAAEYARNMKDVTLEDDC